MPGDSWRKYLPPRLRERIEVNTYLMRRLLAHVASELPPGSRVLDAGAGEGRFKPLFAHTRYIGVDLAVGDATWDYSGLDAINTLDRLCFADASFDAVVFTQVMEHLPEPGAVVGELARVLRPGGLLILVAPQSWHEHQIPYDFYRYTSYGIRYLLEKHGLQVTQMRALGGYFWYLSFQLQQLPYWTFSRNRGALGLPAAVRLPLKAATVALFEVALPLLLFELDRLDRVQEATLGHFCLARKPAPPPASNRPPDR